MDGEYFYGIPWIGALITFESAAQLGSPSQAVKELRTSQPAISRHTADLETRLSAQWFAVQSGGEAKRCRQPLSRRRLRWRRHHPHRRPGDRHAAQWQAGRDRLLKRGEYFRHAAIGRAAGGARRAGGHSYSGSLPQEHAARTSVALADGFAEAGSPYYCALTEKGEKLLARKCRSSSRAPHEARQRECGDPSRSRAVAAGRTPMASRHATPRARSPPIHSVGR